MTDTTALIAFRDMVKAGAFPYDLTGPEMGFPDTSAAVLYEAFGGSLDAAKALHESEIPKWKVYSIHQNTGSNLWTVQIDRHTRTAVGQEMRPARAWLVAIILALIAQEGKDT